LILVYPVLPLSSHWVLFHGRWILDFGVDPAGNGIIDQLHPVGGEELDSESSQEHTDEGISMHIVVCGLLEENIRLI
jgi:hypothetical protein